MFFAEEIKKNVLIWRKVSLFVVYIVSYKLKTSNLTRPVLNRIRAELLVKVCISFKHKSMSSTSWEKCSEFLQYMRKLTKLRKVW